MFHDDDDDDDDDDEQLYVLPELRICVYIYICINVLMY